MALDLTTFFANTDWYHRFDEYVLAHGKKLSSPKFLTSLNLEPLDDGYLLTACVDGYDTEINLWPESDTHWNYDTSCNCDFGSFCPHAGAALLRAARPNTLARLLRGGGTSSQKNPAKETSQLNDSPVQKDTTVYQPTFQLQVSEEPANARVVQLLLQALKIKQRDT